VESARLDGWDYSGRGWYFVTICTRGKQCHLGSAVNGQIVLSQAGSIAENEIRHIRDHYSNVILDKFVIMPNHVHAILVIEGDHVYSPAVVRRHAGDGASPVSTKRPVLGDIVGGYKAGVSRFCRAAGIVDFGWQARFYEHILRSNAAVHAVRDYIDKNPENWLEDPDRPARIKYR
jgi:REP element-mobilizing transposase RayT